MAGRPIVMLTILFHGVSNCKKYLSVMCIYIHLHTDTPRPPPHFLLQQSRLRHILAEMQPQLN